MASNKELMLIARAKHVHYQLNDERFEHDGYQAHYYVNLNKKPEKHVIEVFSITDSGQKVVHHDWSFRRDLIKFHIHRNSLRFAGKLTKHQCEFRLYFLTDRLANDVEAARAFSRQIRGWMGANTDEKFTNGVFLANSNNPATFMCLLRRFNFNGYYHDDPAYYRRRTWQNNRGFLDSTQVANLVFNEIGAYSASSVLNSLTKIMNQCCGPQSGLDQTLDDQDTIRRYEAYNNSEIVKVFHDRSTDRFDMLSFSAYFEAPYNRPHLLTKISNGGRQFQIGSYALPDTNSIDVLIATARVACPINGMPGFSFPNVARCSLMWCFVHEANAAGGTFKPMVVVLPNTIRYDGAIQTMVTYALRPNATWKTVCYFVAATENFGRDHSSQEPQPIRWFRFIEIDSKGRMINDMVNWAFTLIPRHSQRLPETKITVENLNQ